MSISNDQEIKKILLRNASTLRERSMIVSMESVEETRVNNVMIANLYKLAIEKSQIDFDNIPDTKGDITKYVGYSNMLDSISIIRDLSKQSNMKIKELDIIEQALQNMVSYRAQFTKGFLLNKELIELMYNLLVAATVEATSIIIASYIDFIKSPTKINFVIVDGRRGMGHTSIRSLDQFNLSVKSGDFGKVINTISSDKENLLGGMLMIPIVLVGSLSVIVPLLRELTYYFYFSKMTTADFLKHQSYLLEINKNSVKSSNLPPSKKKEVLKKQEVLARRMSDYADKITINIKTAEKLSSSESEKENKTMTIKEMQSQASTLDTSGFIL